MERYDPARNIAEIDNVVIPSRLMPLRGIMAMHMANSYSMQNPDSPNALPWRDLSDEIRKSNFQTADRTIKVLLKRGYKLNYASETPVNWITSTVKRSDGSSFTVKLVDTKRIQKGQAAEIDKAAEDVMRPIHDGWSVDKMNAGWTYGPQRDNENKKHPDLIPFEQLTEKQKSWDKVTAKAVLEVMVAAGIEL